MQHVWFLFKLLEVIVGSCCLGFHICSLDEIEPLPHVVFYCGTFFGYTIISFFGTIGILLGRGPKPLMEAITNTSAAAMYIFASILAMYHAEGDFHLMYLSDFEEPLHNFFRHCKYQSIASLACGLLYLLHSIYAFDVVCITKRQLHIFEDEHEEANQPIRLYFISETVQKYLERYSWFRRYSEGDLSKTSDYRFATPRKVQKLSQPKSQTMPQRSRVETTASRSRVATTASRSSTKASSEISTENHLRGGGSGDFISSESSQAASEFMESIEIV